MALEIQIRTAPNIDARAASELVRVSFNELAASEWEPNARDVFLSESSAESLEAKVKSCAYAAGAFLGGKMVGFLLMPRPELLGMLFVHPDWLRRGIGKALWGSAREQVEGKVTTVELNATPNAVPFYASLGFMPISAELTHAGCRFTRMACWLPARALEAGKRVTVVTGSHTLEEMKEDMHRSMQLGDFDELKERDIG